MEEPAIKKLITAVNGSRGTEGYTFVMPRLGPDQANLREAHDDERRTRALTGPARVLTLQRHVATYCHRNPERKKRIFVKVGRFRLWIQVRERMMSIELSQGTAYDIPANTWHAVECLMASANAPGQLLIETDKDVNDAVWEQAAA